MTTFGVRRHERFPIRVPLYIHTVDGRTMKKLIHLESRDISAGGVCFETSVKVPLEADSRVLLSGVGDLDGAAQIQARVAHREKDPKTGRYTIGLEFTDFIRVSREELIAHIQSWRQAG